MLLAVAACSRNTFAAPAVDRAAIIREGPPLPLTQVWILGQSGPSPSDTTVRFVASAGRTVVIRHAPPDNSIYAIVDFPAGSVAPTAGDTAVVLISPTPGQFGVAITSPGSIASGVQATFSYATHFQAPSDAVSRYPSPTRFEQSMGAASLGDNGIVTFVPTARPAADMIRFPVAGEGTFVLAAPR